MIRFKKKIRRGSCFANSNRDVEFESSSTKLLSSMKMVSKNLIPQQSSSNPCVILFRQFQWRSTGLEDTLSSPKPFREEFIREILSQGVSKFDLLHLSLSDDS